ncbi:MAG: homoserine O-succinyltransferase [Peptococcaceae bacterium]|jgi:homoserine O-succinyltransferase|nr:homoserine O-succinyltransferase [Peptococcaceae bacterium]
MPLTLPSDLPAVKTLSEENIFVMTEDRARTQDIRPLEIAIVNLMPTKIATETQFLRLLSNTPLQVEITLVQMENHVSKNTSQEHLTAFYQTFADIRHRRFDGMIITGAAVETLPFAEVDYWHELCALMEWTKTHVYNTFHVCWAAQAGMYYHYGVPKYPLAEKMFGVFSHDVLIPSSRLMRGFDREFYAPHSRHTTAREADIVAAGIEVMAKSPEAGVYIAATPDRRQVFITGHSEYDALTLDAEYRRDLAKGLPIRLPKNYYQDDQPDNPPVMRWQAHAYLLFANWLNYYVYQETPFNLSALG